MNAMEVIKGIDLIYGGVVAVLLLLMLVSYVWVMLTYPEDD
jgi:hypothetical protein